jgi:hypothetical protein
MQQIELEFTDEFEFFCPVTGNQILYVDEFQPSPAMVFCYLEDEDVFEEANDWTRQIFNLEDDDNYLDSESFRNDLSTILGNNETRNLICFTITTCSMGCGPMSSIVHFCIDMGYKKEFTSNIK